MPRSSPPGCGQDRAGMGCVRRRGRHDADQQRVRARMAAPLGQDATVSRGRSRRLVRRRRGPPQAAARAASVHRSAGRAAVTFSELSLYLDRLESTSSRNELVKTLAELYQKSAPEEIQPLTYLIQGRLVPFFEPVEIGLGEKLVEAALAEAYGKPREEVAKLYGRVGDLGLVAAELAGTGAGTAMSVSEV